MTDPTAPQDPTQSLRDWTTPPAPGVTVAPARIGALRSAGMAAAVLLAVVAVADLADWALTPLVVADPNGPVALAALGAVLLEVVGFLGTAVAFITWLVIAARNVRSWGIRTTYGPGWAIGAWLIPLANLVLPILVVRETARASATAHGPQVPPQYAKAGLIGSWWGTLIASGLCARAAAGKTFTTDEGAEALGYAFPGMVLFVIAAVLAILVIRHINDLQTRRQAAIDAAWQPGLPY